MEPARDVARHVRAGLAGLATPSEVMACDPALADTAAFLLLELPGAEVVEGLATAIPGPA